MVMYKSKRTVYLLSPHIKVFRPFPIREHSLNFHKKMYGITYNQYCVRET